MKKGASRAPLSRCARKPDRPVQNLPAAPALPSLQFDLIARSRQRRPCGRRRSAVAALSPKPTKPQQRGRSDTTGILLPACVILPQPSPSRCRSRPTGANVSPPWRNWRSCMCMVWPQQGGHDIEPAGLTDRARATSQSLARFGLRATVSSRMPAMETTRMVFKVRRRIPWAETGSRLRR